MSVYEAGTPHTGTMTADDFFTGVIAALAIKGTRSMSIRDGRLDRALERAYRSLLERAGNEDLDVEFRIKLHPIHHDSPTVRECLTSAVQNDLISLDNPEYQDLRIKIDSDDAHHILEWLPGSESLFLDLADEVLQTFSPITR